MNWLAERCREHAKLAALREGERTWTYEDILHSAAKLPRTPVLATWMPPTAAHAAILLAGLAAGIPVAPILHRLPLREALRRAAWVGAEKLITPDGPQHVDQPARAPSMPIATLLWSSGSTGEPRCLAHTAEAHLASALASSSRIPLHPGASWKIQLPLAHISGLAILFRCVEAGATALFGAGEPTHLSLVPTQLRRALANPPPGRLEALLLGGAPAPRDLLVRATDAGWPVHLTYGLTEMASQVCTTHRLVQIHDPPTVGHPLPSVEVRERSGRMELRGPMLAAGEWTPHGLQPLADSEGWFRTSDLGRTLPNGSWQILGRADRVIISGGENISPEPIEAAFEELPGIERAIIIAVPHQEYGQRPIAFLRGHLPENWKDQLLKKFPAFALPDRILPLPPTLVPGDQKVTASDIRTLEDISSRLP